MHSIFYMNKPQAHSHEQFFSPPPLTSTFLSCETVNHTAQLHQLQQDKMELN